MSTNVLIKKIRQNIYVGLNTSFHDDVVVVVVVVLLSRRAES